MKFSNIYSLIPYVLNRYGRKPEDESSKEFIQLFENIVNFREAYTLEDFPGTDYNFLYDKKSKVVFVDLDSGCHQIFMSQLESLRMNITYFQASDVFDSSISEEKLADKYIIEGHGFYLSSITKGDFIHVSRRFRWTDDEIKRFGKYKPVII